MEAIKLDLIPGKQPPSVNASQFDIGRQIRFNLYEGATAYELTGDEVITVTVRKPDGTVCEYEVDNTADKYVIIETTEQMCAVSGIACGEITIKDSDASVSTANFNLVIEQSPSAGGITSESDIENLETQIEQIVSDKSYTRAEVDAIAEEIREEIPSADTFATVELVNSEIERVEGLIPDVSGLATKTELNTGLNEKADKTSVYTKSESDTITDAIRNAIPDVSGLATKTELTTGLNSKADKSNTYTKNEVDVALSSKADTSDIPDMTDYYTKTATDSLLSNKADTNALEDKADKSTTYTKTEVDNLLDDKADKSTTYTKSEVDTALADKANTTDLPDMSEYYDKSEVDGLLADKADTATTYTKTEVDGIATTRHNINLEFINGVIFSNVTKDFYEVANAGYCVISADSVNELIIEHAYVYRNNTPCVWYFSDTPSSSTYISYQGSGDITATQPELIENVVCNIPTNCRYILIQGYYTADSRRPVASVKMSLPEYSDYIDGIVSDLSSQTKKIKYSFATDLLLEVNYGSEKLSFTFGKRGPNNLPDFKFVTAGNRELYLNSTDWLAPYIVAAKNNIDGDDIDNKTFTGGNHNYNNTGDTSGTATARNAVFVCYADGKLISTNESGNCDTITIKITNFVQAYNTRKVNGTGREVLTETRIITFDGAKFDCVTKIQPLEDVKVETWYGYQIGGAFSWNNVVFVGGVNRTPDVYTNSPISSNATPNSMECWSNTDKVILEIDRNYDIGKGTYYNSTMGMFASGQKYYCFLIKDADLAADACYFSRGSWSFMPT